MTEPHPRKSKAGFARILAAAVYSVDGLKTAYRHESAFRQELLLAAVLVPTAVLLDVSALHKAVLLGALGVVLITELLNSAVEAVVDCVSLADHELAKRAKDLGSAAVLLSLLSAAVTWSLVLGDRYL